MGTFYQAVVGTALILTQSVLHADVLTESEQASWVQWQSPSPSQVVIRSKMKTQFEVVAPGGGGKKEFLVNSFLGQFDTWSLSLYDSFNIQKLSEEYFRIRVRLFPIIHVPGRDPYAVTADRNNVQLYNSSGLKIRERISKTPIAEGQKVVFDFARNSMLVDAKRYSLKEVEVIPQGTVTTTLRADSGAYKREYRGHFIVMPTLFEESPKEAPQNGWTEVLWSVINSLPVEDYLKSVVPSEMPLSFELEALKAQAVAARTYATFHQLLARQMYLRDWDVDPTTWYQSYQGATLEQLKVTEAVNQTAGEIMSHNGQVIEAFFSANSGGVTCTVQECFDQPDRPYIVSVLDDSDVLLKPGGKWSAEVDTKGIETRLKKLESESRLKIEELIPGYTSHLDLSGFTAHETGAAGRIKKLAILLKNGAEIPLEKDWTKEMRWQFGMKTHLFNLGSPISARNTIQKITGYGLGHGVGMSQWGAQVMALKNRTHTEILNYYYNQIKIETLAH